MSNEASEPSRGSALSVLPETSDPSRESALSVTPLHIPRYDKPNAHVWCILRILELVETDHLVGDALATSMDELTELVCSKLDRAALSEQLIHDDLHPKQRTMVRAAV